MFHVEHWFKVLIFQCFTWNIKSYPQFIFGKFLLWITFYQIGNDVRFDSYPQVNFYDVYEKWR